MARIEKKIAIKDDKKNKTLAIQYKDGKKKVKIYKRYEKNQ